MKFNKTVTAKDIKEIAASIRELAIMLEGMDNLKCAQAATLKTKKLKGGRLDMDVSFKFSLVEAGDVREVGEFLEGINE